MEEHLKKLSRILNELNNTPEISEVFWMMKAALSSKYSVTLDKNMNYVVKRKEE